MISFFHTATSGTIKTIQIDFPSSFNLGVATRLIERDGIGSGTLSMSGTSLIYTVNNPVNIPTSTSIRLEVARIIARAAGSHTVNMKTMNTGGSNIDGPTTSGAFVIKSITGEDVSTGFMIKKILFDKSKYYLNTLTFYHKLHLK